MHARGPRYGFGLTIYVGPICIRLGNVRIGYGLAGSHPDRLQVRDKRLGPQMESLEPYLVRYGSD